MRGLRLREFEHAGEELCLHVPDGPELHEPVYSQPGGTGDDDAGRRESGDAGDEYVRQLLDDLRRRRGDGAAKRKRAARRHELRDGVYVPGECDADGIGGRECGDAVREHGGGDVQPGRRGAHDGQCALGGYELLAAGGVDAGRELEPGDDGDLRQFVGGDAA